MTRSHVDVVVVGAGIAGLSVAAELARDADVLVLEQQDQPATQATGRSAAQFIVDYGGPRVRPFTEASREWFESGDEFVSQSLLSVRGMLIVAAPGDEHVLADHASPSRHPVDLAAVTDLFPAARPERIGAALFDPTVADIDVAEAVAARGRALVERKALRRWGEALVRGGRVGSSWRIETTAQTWWADEIVDAAGAWGDAVAESCGIAPIGLRPLRRTACTFRASSELMHERWPLLSDARETWYLKPEPGQFLASPADETPSLPSDTRPEETDVAITLDRVRENTTLDPRSITSAWAGLRTFAPDRGLVIGRDAAEPSFVWCVGQGGFGIQTSPAVARAARDLLRTGTISPELSGRGLDASSVSPARFGRSGE